MNTETHANAGIYFPVTLVDGNLVNVQVQGETVRADVYADGSYTVWAGFQSIAEGKLDGTEGDLMVYFIAEALIWSAGIDDEMNADAERQLAETIEHVDANEISDAVAAVRADGARRIAQADELTAQGDAPVQVVTSAGRKITRYASDPRHPFRAAETVRRAGERLAAWTQADEDGYNRYVSDGLADTDGYYAPLDRAAWSWNR